VIERTFEELVRDLRQRRTEAEPPPVLLLGAGASVGAGLADMSGLMRAVGADGFGAFSAYIAPLTAGERYRLLAEYLQTREPMEVTPGYRALARLCEQLYFDLILTTNLDPLLEDAISGTTMRRRDWLLLVNGVLRADRIDTILGAGAPRLKVVKLHGDLFHRFMAWTPEEMGQWVTDIATPVGFAVRNRDFLVVGSSLRDEEIRELAMGSGGVVWFTTPNDVPDIIADSDAVRAVTGADAAFETLFTRLAGELTAPVEPVRRTRAARSARRAAAPAPARGEEALNLDDLMRAVVGIVNPAGMPGATGFLLAEPRVIVADVSGVPEGVETVEIAPGDGRRLRAAVLARGAHPFGPVVLEAPEGLRVQGLALTPDPAEADLPVRIAVAAGDRVGMSDGVVATGRAEEIDIVPTGRVGGLVRISAETAPGASGAPVVDPAMAVRGLIVAGAPGAPTSYMLPAGAWVDDVAALAAKGDRRRAGRGGRRPTRGAAQ
jgi:hypothetical protein